MRQLLGLTLFAMALRGQTASDAEIRAMLADRIDTLHQSVGIVVGIIDGSGRRYVSYGQMGLKDARPVGTDTVFEIGSTTKVFTSTILADMVRKGEVALDDPVAKYLPKEAKIPERGGKQITLLDLATHSSGLPSLPSNLKPKDANNPYADYTDAQLWEFLSGYQLTRDVGTKFQYSNLGVGLLGQALARRAGMDYEALVRARVTGPLKMENTRIALTPAMKAHLAAGHTATREPAENWDLPVFAGAGALRSDVRDMLTFVGAPLGYVQSPLAEAMASMTKVRRPAMGDMEIGLAWIVPKATEAHEIYWHNGGTGGYRTFMGYDAKTRVGVVVLSNMSTNVGVDDIGMHLLNPAAPLAKLPVLSAHKEIKLAPEALEKYVGVYEFAPNVTLTVTREGGQLYAMLTGQPRFEVYPETERDFFLKVVDAQLTFDGDAVVLHQNGRDQRATKK
ncbi:MAG: beta-lactamase [Candidatus Solibacter sp.]|nr:beta-lactamase [Candidatus Solibacter sp.]